MYSECVGKFAALEVCVRKETEDSFNFVEIKGEAMGIFKMTEGHSPVFALISHSHHPHAFPIGSYRIQTS